MCAAAEKLLCLARRARPVHCVAIAPLCAGCDPHPDEVADLAAFIEHTRACRPCAVISVWANLSGFPNTADDPRAERVRRVFATGSPLSDEERALL